MKKYETIKNQTVHTKKKAVVGAAAILGACTLLFGAATQSVLAAETNKQENVPTNYPSSSATQQKMDGYVKGNYKVVKDPDIPGNPTANDITMEKAADIGAENIWKFFGTNLDGKTIKMTYNKAVAPNERATWYGWIADDIHRGTPSQKGSTTAMSYGFEVDAMTGAINSVHISRVLPTNQGNAGTFEGYVLPGNAGIFEGYDTQLEKNCQVYKDLARTLTEQHNLLGGKIKSVEYYGQGRTNNDPNIIIAVKSEQGEEIRLEFSRYDKKLLGYCSNSWVQAANILEQQKSAEAENASETVVYEFHEDENGNVTPKLVQAPAGVETEVVNYTYTTTK